MRNGNGPERCLQDGCGRLVEARRPLCHMHGKESEDLARCQVCGCMTGERYWEKRIVQGEYRIRFSSQKWNPNSAEHIRALRVCGGCEKRHQERGCLLLAGSQ